MHIFIWIYRNLNIDKYQTHLPFTTSKVDFLSESGLYSSQEPAFKKPYFSCKEVHINKENTVNKLGLY